MGENHVTTCGFADCIAPLSATTAEEAIEVLLIFGQGSGGAHV